MLIFIARFKSPNQSPHCMEISTVDYLTLFMTAFLVVTVMLTFLKSRISYFVLMPLELYYLSEFLGCIQS